MLFLFAIIISYLDDKKSSKANKKHTNTQQIVYSWDGFTHFESVWKYDTNIFHVFQHNQVILWLLKKNDSIPPTLFMWMQELHSKVCSKLIVHVLCVTQNGKFKYSQ